MLMIVRLYPKTDLSKVWNHIETKIKDDPSKSFTPLYATQTEGMMDIGVIVDVEKPDDLSDFITEDLVQCDEIHHTKTISLMNPVFFPIPKKRPEPVQRYLVRIYAHPKYYKKVYDHLINFNYPFNLFPIYISYSLGGEDIIMSIGADHSETVNRFLKANIKTLDGVDQSSFYPVFKAKRFAPLEKLIAERKKYTTKEVPGKETDETFDWVESFEEYARLTGAFPGDY